MQQSASRSIKFIDLFAGLGGTRIGFEKACKKLNINAKCVFTSELKPYAIETYKNNFPNTDIFGDITQIDASEIPQFDCLLAGFPCQAFSTAGNRKGFMDTRGTLFFEIERILKKKKPSYLILENVEGLVTHDRIDPKKKIGRTLETILKILNNLGYKVSWKVFNGKDFGVAQDRKRIFIVGCKRKKININNIKKTKIKYLRDILQSVEVKHQTSFQKKLISNYKSDLSFLYGKSIKDKRGGENNIHSWDLELKGKVTKLQKELLSEILTQRRRKIWAIQKKIKWMDGMPLSLNEIFSFFCKPDLFKKTLTKKELKKELEILVRRGYLSKEYPKKVKIIKKGNRKLEERVEDKKQDIAYNIVVGKLSFEINKILDPNDFTPTLVATDMDRLHVIDKNKLRPLTIREGLRLFGFPEKYKMNLSNRNSYDLLGNSIIVPIVKEVSLEMLS